MALMNRLLSGLRGWPQDRQMSLPAVVAPAGAVESQAGGMAEGGEDDTVGQAQREIEQEDIEILLIGDEEQSENAVFPSLVGLSEPEFRIVPASQLAKALQLFRHRDIGIIVLEADHLNQASLARLDYIMAWEPPCPVIILYGSADDAEIDKAFQAGVDDCLPRHMVRPSRFFHFMDRVLERRAQFEMKLGGMETAQELPPFHIVQEAHEGLVIVDRSGIVRFANDPVCRLLKQSAEDLMGKPFPFPMQMNGRNTVAIEEDPDNPIHAELRAVETDWGGYPARLVSVQDVTARRLIERELEKAKDHRASAEKTARLIREEIRTRILPLIEQSSVDDGTAQGANTKRELRQLASNLKRMILSIETRLRTAKQPPQHAATGGVAAKRPPSQTAAE